MTFKTGRWVACAAGLLLGAAIPGQVRSDDPTADALQKKGLRRVNTTFVLRDEIEVSKQVRTALQLKRSVYAARKVLAAAEKKAQSFEQLIAQAREQRSQLRHQLSAATTVRQNNQLVSAVNELGDKIAKFQEQGAKGKELSAAQAAETKAQEAYVEQVLKLRKLYDQTVDAYEGLKADSEVTDAIAQYNSKAEKQAQLGPSAVFLRQDATIKRIEDTVLSAKIPLRAGEDRLLYVNVVFPGNRVIEFSIDTGASSVLLPAKTASEIGLVPLEGDVDVQIQLADGRLIDAKKKIIPKMRVGKFEAEEVECVVLPANLPDATPLLGQSFLKHFTYKVDAAAATLTMTRIE